MKYAKGIMWLDDCRIPFVDAGENTTRGKYENKVQVGIMAERPNIKFVGSFDDSAKQGRFTPNLLVCDDLLNDGKTYGNLFKQNRNKDVDGGTGNSLVRAHKQGESNGIFDNGTTSSRFYDLDTWFDKMLEKL